VAQRGEKERIAEEQEKGAGIKYYGLLVLFAPRSYLPIKLTT
jgi:hypothetical protein